ncbi:endonuclease [Streptomyces sp. BE303]|uniref:endonuclease I family protein n=1 Tax=Streptomycetaceae TaxID=2062 RepID=UPI002E79C65B|nr:endonuclease [Streptomyces sp. BE303]MED7953044.1 endonuclease [Streptomyces sp. BE303]
MSVAQIRRWKALAAAATVLVGLALPAVAAPTASAAAGPYDSTYYKNAIGKTGAGLKASLHTIIGTGQTKISYDAVWNALKVLDQDPNNTANVILLYSGTSRAKSLNGGSVGNWNREHVWAQSHGNFGTSAGPGTDLHHLRAADVQVNSTRGNKDFDKGGSAVGGAPGSYTDADSFEPRDADKGDVARMILYMAVRYEGDDSWPDLEPNDSINGSTRFHGRLSVLKQWNEQDPPSDFEKRRNQIVFDTYQKNRNPFVDHPEWVAAIW